MFGSTVGPYRVLEQLGAGGMGVVFRARDPRLERDIALKVLPADSFSTPAAHARLLREARAAAGLNHPHICTVYEVGEVAGRAYIAMELVEGEPLSAVVERGPLAPAQVARYGLQLADALAHAHDRGIVHRDFKSANVVLSGDGRAKVLDFGLAKRAQEGVDEETRSGATLTQPGALVGTLVYMAPEQLRGEPADARSDVWALGVVLYEMAVGERPFKGSTGFQVSSRILGHPPRPLPSTVPLALRAVIERCLEKEPGRRYRNGGEVRAALEAAQVARPWAGWQHVLRRRLALPAAAALALLTTAIVGFDLGGVRHRLAGGPAGPRIESVVVLPLTNLSGNPDEEHVADGMTEALIAELSSLRGLNVVSRTSAMQYKGISKPLRDIVGELGVDGVIEGGVLREGNAVRVTINLVDGQTGRNMWAQSFEREAAGILVLHSEMVRAIADGIHLTLSPQERAVLAGARAVNPEAYEAYLKGRMHWYKQTPHDVDRALQYFEFAVGKDPDFPLAYLGMAYIWTYYTSAGLAPPGEMRAKVTDALRRAREIDPNLAEAYEAEADFKFYYDWDWAGAERDYRRAIELKPNSADMRLYYWEFLAAMGRMDEAREQIERCVALDPFNSYVQMAYGMFLLSSRRFEEAVTQFREVLRTNMDFGPANLGLWQAYHHLSRPDEALAAAHEYFSRWGDDELADLLERGYAAHGYEGAMRLAAEALAARSEYLYVLAIQVAGLFAYAGNVEPALGWLERAYAERETGLVKLQIDPDWDILRGEPRFQDLVRRMGYPPL